MLTGTFLITFSGRTRRAAPLNALSPECAAFGTRGAELLLCTPEIRSGELAHRDVFDHFFGADKARSASERPQSRMRSIWDAGC